MKLRLSRAYGGVIVLFVFACLLLAGAGRLIESETASESLTDLSQRQAWLCAAPSFAQEQLPGAQSEARLGEDHRLAASEKEKVHNAGLLLLRSDANGNVLLGSESYLKTVYRAFPLGDGFA